MSDREKYHGRAVFEAVVSYEVPEQPIHFDNDLELIQLARRGVSKKTLLKLAEYGSISLKTLAQLLPVSERTIQRYKESDTFSTDVSEHLLLIAKVIAKGYEVFNSREDLHNWLHAPLISLGRRTPLSLLDTSFGAQLVIDTLGRLEHGIYS